MIFFNIYYLFNVKFPALFIHECACGLFVGHSVGSSVYGLIPPCDCFSLDLFHNFRVPCYFLGFMGLLMSYPIRQCPQPSLLGTLRFDLFQHLPQLGLGLSRKGQSAPFIKKAVRHCRAVQTSCLASRRRQSHGLIYGFRFSFAPFGKI